MQKRRFRKWDSSPSSKTRTTTRSHYSNQPIERKPMPLPTSHFSFRLRNRLDRLLNRKIFHTRLTRQATLRGQTFEIQGRLSQSKDVNVRSNNRVVSLFDKGPSCLISVLGPRETTFFQGSPEEKGAVRGRLRDLARLSTILHSACIVEQSCRIRDANVDPLLEEAPSDFLG